MDVNAKTVYAHLTHSAATPFGMRPALPSAPKIVMAVITTMAVAVEAFKMVALHSTAQAVTDVPVRAVFVTWIPTAAIPNGTISV